MASIIVPESVKEALDSEVASGQYRDAAEYIEFLINEHELRKEEEKLEALLLEGLNSGEATEFTEQDWKDIREEGIAMAKHRSV